MVLWQGILSSDGFCRVGGWPRQSSGITSFTLILRSCLLRPRCARRPWQSAPRTYEDQFLFSYTYRSTSKESYYTIPNNNAWVPIALQFCLHLLFSSYLISAIPGYCIVVLIFIFPHWECAYCPFYRFVSKVSILVICFSTVLILYFKKNHFTRFILHFEYKFLSYVCTVNIFSSDCGWSFSFLNSVFWCSEDSNLNEVWFTFYLIS